jgi:hypothetical protein
MPSARWQLQERTSEELAAAVLARTGGPQIGDEQARMRVSPLEAKLKEPQDF